MTIFSLSFRPASEFLSFNIPFELLKITCNEYSKALEKEFIAHKAISEKLNFIVSFTLQVFAKMRARRKRSTFHSLLYKNEMNQSSLASFKAILKFCTNEQLLK